MGGGGEGGGTGSSDSTLAGVCVCPLRVFFFFYPSLFLLVWLVFHSFSLSLYSVNIIDTTLFYFLVASSTVSVVGGV
ncbi:hypothetical protein DFP73DRAFT_549296 [Morchella snyderi]|nr:hypothetical protein DFP73DRAFT_549296 [Morchella snyderi]